MSKSQHYADLLGTIMQSEKSPEKFLDVVFDFLNQRTTFFMESSDDPQGSYLPTGAAKKMVDKIFTKHQMKKSEGAAALLQRKAARAKKAELLQKKKAAEKVVKKTPTTQEEFQAESDSFNGAVRDRYTWSQNYGEVDVKVHLPPHIKKASQVRVGYNVKHLSVEVEEEGEGKQMKKFIDCDLKFEINPYEDSATTWCFEPGFINVSFKKKYIQF